MAGYADPEYEAAPATLNLNLRDVQGMPARAKGRLLKNKEIMENPNSLTTTRFAVKATKKIEG
jgi:hypothetical protein